MATTPTSHSGFGPSALATPANAVTIARVVATPVLVGMIVRDGATWPAFLFWFVLSCTDGVDGWLARRQGTTRSGAFLDPLADKVVVLSAMLALVAIGAFWWLPVMLIAGREICIIAYRTSAGRRGITTHCVLYCLRCVPSGRVSTPVSVLSRNTRMLAGPGSGE